MIIVATLEALVMLSHHLNLIPASLPCLLQLVSDLMRQDMQSDPSVSTPPPAHQEGPEDSGQDTEAVAQSASPSVAQDQDIHPAERKYSPIVTCRYPETDWEDAEPFPLHLPMVSPDVLGKRKKKRVAVISRV